MTDDNLFPTADKMLAAMDFAAQQALLEDKHRESLSVLLRDILEVLDSLHSLEAHMADTSSDEEVNPLRSVQIIIKQTLRALRNAGVEPMNAVGHPVDLDRHEIERVQETLSAEDDSVLAESQRGYLWKFGVLRRAKVVVAQSRAGDDPATVNEDI